MRIGASDVGILTRRPCEQRSSTLLNDYRFFKVSSMKSFIKGFVTQNEKKIRTSFATYVLEILYGMVI